ncbi:MAG TPA: 2OG-Fe(II) oxygenase, partial [Allocoleopsis sp.]
AVVCFPSDRIVALQTEPPVYWQPIQDAKPPVPDELASDYVQIDNFLTVDEHNQLLDYVFQRESAFVPTSTSTGDTDYRRSMILYSFPEFSNLIVNRIQAIIPDVLRKLRIPSFAIADIEAQLTAHNDGNYYKVHNDNGSSDTVTREFTYVYYFYREPKPFSGGELLIYDSKIENNFYVKADSFQTVEPHNNSIVFFLSRYLHEVLPVRCPSQAFADSRFTINGWIRRQST